MTPTLRRYSCALLLGASLPACLTTHTESRTGTIDVTSDPPGANITRTDGSGKVAVGQAPLDVPYRYDVDVKEFPFTAGWILAGTGWAVTAGSGYFLADSVYQAAKPGASCSDGSCVPVIVASAVGLGLGIALGATMTAVTADKHKDVGVFPHSQDPVTITATAEGRQTQELLLNLNEPQSKMAFLLPPSSVETALAQNAAPASVQVNPLGVHGMVFAHGSPQPTAYALIVGIGHYRDLGSPAGAHDDAEAFAQLAAITLGIPERNVRLLLDDHAGRGDIMKSIAWLKANVPEGGRIYFYFAGHGAPDVKSGDPYLVPYDGDPSYLDGTALKISAVTDALADTRAKDVIAILDSCFSGSGDRSVLPAGTRPLVPVKQVSATNKVTLFSAAGPDETSGSVEGGSGGLFTRYVLEGLGQGRADANADGQVTLEELKGYVGPRVQKEAARANRQQHPQITSSTPGDVVMAVGVSP